MATLRLNHHRRPIDRLRDRGAAPVTPALAAAWLGRMGGRCSAFIPLTPQAVSNRSGLASTISRHMLAPRATPFGPALFHECLPTRSIAWRRGGDDRPSF